MFHLPKPCLSAQASALVGTALLSLAGPVQALTVRCVGNSQQLADAIAEANTSVDSVFSIRLREGVYTNSNALSYDIVPRGSNRLIELSGGWSGANLGCQSKRFDPALTTLIGTASRAALGFSLHSLLGQADNLVYLIDLSFTNPGFTQEAHGACLRGSIESGHSASLDRIHAHACFAPFGSHASINLSNRGTLTARNIYVRDGAALNNGGLRVDSYADAVAHLAQITVTGTQSSGDGWLGSGVTLITFGNGLIHLGNSVTWGNDGDADTQDLWINGAGVVLTRVHYGSIEGSPAGNIAPGTGDPGFVSVNDARLRPHSPLIDSGTDSPQGGAGTFDADGRSRVQGAAIDVGAFEATPTPDLIFRDGFQADTD